MGNYDKLSLPLDGDKIEKDSEQKLTVPNQPIIPVIEGDGIGRDIMKATRGVIDAAVQKAFDGEKQIVWFDIYSMSKQCAKTVCEEFEFMSDLLAIDTRD